METIYAALILHKAQKDITETNIEKILKAADVNVDKAQLTVLDPYSNSKTLRHIKKLSYI